MRKVFLFSILMLALASVGHAQGIAVSFTVDVDVIAPITPGTIYAYANCYCPTADKFLSYNSGRGITVHNAVTGASEATMDNGTADPSGLGFFGIAAGSDGVIYGFNNNDGGMYQWASTAAVPALATSGLAFARNGHVQGTGASTVVWFTGSANDGPIEKYTTADGTTFALAEVVPAAAARSKSGFAVNAAGDAVWAVGDTNTNVQKGVNPGSGWVAEDTTFIASTDAAGSGPMTYDNSEDIVLTLKTNGDTVFAIDGTTGATVGSQALTDDTYGTPGYNGAWVDETGKQVWMAWRATTGNAHFAKLTYLVTSVDDWTLY